MRVTQVLLVGLMALVLIGCGSIGGNPAATGILPTDPPQAAQASRANRHLWGLWDVTISADRNSAQVVPLRSAEMHLNLVRLLEVTPCTTCLKISNVHVIGTNEIQADVTLQHPYPGLIKYTGFDVRGIFISGSDFTFPWSGRKVAVGDGLPRLLDPDGFTPLFNPTEFPETQPGPPALRYIPGKLATDGDFTATLNPFVAYKRDAPRRMFESGGVETRTVHVYLPPGPIHFGYAVDACWQLVENVVDPVTDFPPDANCLEAYRVLISVDQELNAWPGCSIPISVEVFDHQGSATISALLVEAPGLFDGEHALAFSGATGNDSWRYAGYITNELGSGWGDYPFLVRVVDTEVDQNLGEVDAWSLASVGVRDGWARTWGGGDADLCSDSETGHGVAVDSSGNVYVTGEFNGIVDFDPGPGENIQESFGCVDAFLGKFDSNGNLIWARIWGANGGDYGYDVSVDQTGNVYVSGGFQKLVDFDPGPLQDSHVSNDHTTDVSLSKFDSNGTFLWARTWGSNDTYIGDTNSVVAADSSGNAYVAGLFKGTVDFDPGPGEDNHTSSSSDLGDAFLSKFSADGAFQWARTWPEGYASGITLDISGNVYVSGWIGGGYGTFLKKLDSEGTSQWMRTWDAGTFWDNFPTVAADASGGIYVTGSFEKSADFDPGPSEANRTPIHIDAFVSKFDTDGIFYWVETWGGADAHVSCRSIAIDSLGDILVTGYFSKTIDFDPGPDEDNHTANSWGGTFVTKFHNDGIFQWARTWGFGTNFWGRDEGYGVVADSSNSVYLIGSFGGTVDFDPGPGVDNHTSINAYQGPDIFLSKFPPDGNW